MTTWRHMIYTLKMTGANLQAKRTTYEEPEINVYRITSSKKKRLRRLQTQSQASILQYTSRIFRDSEHSSHRILPGSEPGTAPQYAYERSEHSNCQTIYPNTIPHILDIVLQFPKRLSLPLFSLTLFGFLE